MKRASFNYGPEQDARIFDSINQIFNQAEQSRRLIEYCGLEWRDACFDFHKNKRAIRTASVTQVRWPFT